MPDPTLIPVNHDPFNPEMGLQEAWSKGKFLETLGHQLGQTDIARGLKNFVTLPHDVMTGEANLATPEGKQRAVEMAMQMMGGGRGAPKGGIGSGLGLWGKVVDHMKDSPEYAADTHEVAQGLAAIIGNNPGKIKSPSEAVEYALGPTKNISPANYEFGKKTAEAMENHPLAPKPALTSKEELMQGMAELQKTINEKKGGAAQPYSGDLGSHPALSGLVKGSAEHDAAHDILNALHDFPEEYKDPMQVAKDFADQKWVDKSSIPAYNYAAEHLQDYAKKNGEFKFAPQEAATVSNWLDLPLKVAKPGTAGYGVLEAADYQGVHPYDILKEWGIGPNEKGWQNVKEAVEHPDAPKGVGPSPEALKLAGMVSKGEGAGIYTKKTSPLPPQIHPLDRRSTTSPIADALYPVDWQSLQSTVMRPGEKATGEYADKLAQAQALGFNPSFPLFHGTYTGLPYEHAPGVNVLAPEWEGKFKPELGPMNAFADPMKVKPTGESGIFFSDSPEIAGKYSNWAGLHGSGNWTQSPQTMPVLANPKNTLAVHWPSVSGNESYDFDTMSKIIREAQKRDADMLMVHGIRDLGGPQTQYVALKPNILRSPFAAFDPENVSSPVLTHSGGLPLLVPVDHDPWADNGGQNNGR